MTTKIRKFKIVKAWDNRKTAKPFRKIKGRQWNRRIQWVETMSNLDKVIKLRVMENDRYVEVTAYNRDQANLAYDMFKECQGHDNIDKIIRLASFNPKKRWTKLNNPFTENEWFSGPSDIVTK